MLKIIRFLDYFGVVAVATGALWLYTQSRQDDGLILLMNEGIHKPFAAIAALFVGAAMVIVARVMSACLRAQRSKRHGVPHRDHA